MDERCKSGNTPGGAGRQGTRAFGLLLLAACLIGCYQPHVTPGGLKCGPSSKPCPDGFTCVNDVCAAGSGAGGSPGAGGAGGAPSCANAVAPLCASGADAPASCDPVCQTGCPCGQRCLVQAAGLGCATASGQKAQGQVCLPGSDECGPGLACVQESCGANLGRCRRMCRDATVCSDGAACTHPVLMANQMPSGQRACDLGDEPCDPYAATGCPDPALHCYVTGPTRTSCDCPSGVGATEGQNCSAYNDCAVGLACIQTGGAESRCVRLCQSITDCLSCVTLGSIKYCAVAAVD
ncbi:MAG TPA: hypothetical protein VHU40_09575 [Polyangia bacterium]|jgi:hypothetical protein|nr:hypothetical protein [Polyangia bacterium]